MYTIYTNGSFIPPYSLNNNTQLSDRLLWYHNIMKAKLNGIFITIQTIQTIQLDMHMIHIQQILGKLPVYQAGTI